MNLFPLKVCINLDRRPERWQRMQRAFAEQEIRDVRRVPAVDGNLVPLPHNWIHTAGAYGCLRSHVQVVREARDAGASSVLIFEDDAVFDPKFKEKFTRFSKELPADWDMLFLGALHKDEPSKVSEHVARISKANSTFAYAVRNTVFDEFIELNSRAEHVLDMNSYHLQERFNCYCFMPNLVWVESEYSDVQNRLEHHWYIEKSLVLFGEHVDRLLSETAIVLQRKTSAANREFLVNYYREYFPSIAMVESTDLNKEFFILIEDDLYLEAMDIRANLLMCEEQYDAATGFSKVIELTAEQSDQLRTNCITRGIDISNNPFSKNDQCHFLTRRKANRIFQSPNHALRLPGGSIKRK